VSDEVGSGPFRRYAVPRRRSPAAGVGVPDRAEPWWAHRAPGESALADAARRNAARDARARATQPPAPPLPDDLRDSDADEQPARCVLPARSGLVAGIIAALALGIVVADAQVGTAAVAGRALLPIFGLAVAAAVGPMLARRHRDEPWLPRMLVYAMAFKLVAIYLRYQVFSGKGDAYRYDKYGREYALGVAAPLRDHKKTNYIYWLTGIIYSHFGIDIIVGFFVFGLIAFAGSYLWYRATVEAVPFIDKRLYFLLVFFAPSLAFWPSSIGKEAIMLFGMGLTALGAAKILNGRFIRGFLIALPGGYLLWTVRPHLLAFVTLAAGLAYILGRAPRRCETGVSVFRPLGMVVVALLAVFAATQMASKLGMNGLSLKSINQELADVNGQTGQEGSKFNVGNTNLTPLSVPKGIVTILLRPFPFQVHDGNQAVASLECLALALFAFHRRRSLKLSLTRSRDAPYLFFCWTLFVVYATAFSSIANMGLLTRQRSLVLPAMYVLIAIDPLRAERSRSTSREGPRRATT